MIVPSAFRKILFERRPERWRKPGLVMGGLFDITKRITNVNLMYSILPYQLGNILARLVQYLFYFYSSLVDTIKSLA